MASQANNTRRTILKALPAAVASFGISGTALAASGYTVQDHIAEMEKAGAAYSRYGNGIRQNLLNIDVQTFEAAKDRADKAGITAKDIYGALGNVEAGPDDRIKSAMAELKSALTEKYPDFVIREAPPQMGSVHNVATGESYVTSEGLFIVAHAPTGSKSEYHIQRTYKN